MGKPFIKLLHTINAGYFYDVNRNQLVDISEESYQYLQDLLADKEVGTEPEEITYLKQAGYLSDHHVEKIEHPLSRDADIILKRRIQKATLQLTQQCNFRCKYCVYSATDENVHQRKHSSKEMSYETGVKAIDFLAEHAIDCESVNIGYYGGEPLLVFPLIQRLTAYAEERLAAKELTFSLTSNCSLITTEIVQYFIDHKIDLLISFDGPKEIQDTNRVLADGKTGTYDLVHKNLAMIQEKFPEYFKKLSINMVVDPRNSFEVVRSLENDPLFREMRMQISMMDTEFTSEEITSATQFNIEYQYMNFVSNLALLDRIEEGSLPKIISGIVGSHHMLYKKLLERADLGTQSAPGGPCLPGQLRLFSDVNGNLFPCERVSETSKCMCIGTLTDGIDMDKVDALLNVSRITADVCKNCWAFSFCGQCAKLADAGDTLSRNKRLYNCTDSILSALIDLYTVLLKKETETYYA